LRDGATQKTILSVSTLKIEQGSCLCEFKSCLVWVKDEIGMGNYWRVSHEFLLLGVRGSLTFRDRTVPSWIQASRTVHSRKPGLVRMLIERVSPGKYLELYGREDGPC
jgi:N6-adenosine-specific RNA methylase IME4